LTKNKFANAISAIGHPLLTAPLVVAFLIFKTESTQNALIVLGLVVLGVILPVIVKILRQLKKGQITNFDVSDRVERKSFYRFLIPILFLVNLGLYLTDQSFQTLLSFGLATLLLVSLQLVNLFVKASIHVSVNIYLAYLLFEINPYVAIAFGLFITLIAWSRLVLKRHQPIEVVIGFFLGNIFGILFLLIYHLN